MIARLNRRLDDRRDSGFTLIELLIVIVILGVLAAIVVFAIGSTRGDSVASSCKTNFKGVELSAEAVKTKSGKYPALASATNNPADSAAAQTQYAALLNGGAATNGALLKVYPWSADYRLLYTIVPAAAPAGGTVTVPTAADTYSVTVQKPSGVPATPWTSVGTTADGCDSL